MLLFSYINCAGQIANYIANGSFELNYSCTGINYLQKAKYWMGVDSANYGAAYYAACYSNIPSNGNTYQYPRTGNAYVLSTLFCEPSVCPLPSNRGYLKNRLKSNLISGKTYCVKFYVNVSNNSPYGFDAIGAYFGNSNIDTITKCNLPLTYITPQIQNPIGNIITDTLNWALITGTFTANGTEKYCVIGNFKSDASLNTATINPAYLPQKWTDLCIDDVSCIPIDLPAHAGADVWAMAGNTVYIGRAQDVGIDEACTWYNLTNTTTPIANLAGITVTVSATTQTYMVKQDICGVIKYDTVVVHTGVVGLVTLSEVEASLNIFPNPISDKLNIQFTIPDLSKEFTKAEIINSIGQLVKLIELNYTDNTAVINTNELPAGVYHIIIRSESQSINRRFIIVR